MPTLPNGMLKRMICRSSPSSSTIVFSATCELAGFDVVGQLDVAELGAADHSFLFLDRQRIPRLKVMNVLLNHDIAAAGELRILIANHHRVECRRAFRVLGAVDEPEQVALVEGLESMHLVDHSRDPAESIHQPLSELEAQVEPMSAEVEQQIAGRRHGRVLPACDFGERMQTGGTRLAK